MNFLSKLKTMLMIVAILIITYLFSLYNPSQVPIDFYFYETAPMSVGVFGVLATFFGALIMLLVFIFDIAKVNLRERRLQKEIRKLKKQLETYEPQPVENEKQTSDSNSSVSEDNSLNDDENSY